MLKPHRVSSSDLEEARRLSQRISRPANDPVATPAASEGYVDLRDVAPPTTTLDYTAVGEEVASEFEPDLPPNAPATSAQPAPPANARTGQAGAPITRQVAEDTLPDFPQLAASGDIAGEDRELASELAAFERLEQQAPPEAAAPETPSVVPPAQAQEEAEPIDEAGSDVSTERPSEEGGVFTLRNALDEDDDLDELFDDILGPDSHED